MSKSIVEKVAGSVEQVKAWAVRSAWAPIAGKGAAYTVGFLMLGMAGSGRLSQWITPPPLGISAAQAATAPPPTSTVPPRTVAAGATGVPVVASAAAETAGATTVAEVASGKADTPAPPADGASNGVASDGKVILNRAAEEDLRRLPGVGHSRAQAILALRGQMKKFTRVEDLLKVKGLGRRALARLRPLIRVD
jgi:competence protein ComEA